MNPMKSFRSLCTPSQVFTAISLASLGLLLAQNMSRENRNALCVGMYKCRMSPMERAVLFGGHLVYIAVWAIILDSLCRTRYGALAWALVLLPFAMSAIGLGAVILQRATTKVEIVNKA
jgi:hypothetical protein